MVTKNKTMVHEVVEGSHSPPQLGRPKPEQPDPIIVARLEIFLARLDDGSVPIVRSPLEELREEVLGLTRHEASGFFGPYSYSAWCAIEGGAREALPNMVGKTLVRIAGKEASFRFERAWRRWREEIGREAIESAEKKLFPAGPAFGMAQ